MTEIEKQQHLLLNASEILNQIYMAESTILRAEKHFAEGERRSCNGKTKLIQGCRKKLMLLLRKELFLSFRRRRAAYDAFRSEKIYKAYKPSNVVKLTEEVAALR